jgi:hypothetical protein
MPSVFGEIALSCARLEGRRPGCGRNEQMARAGAVYPSRLAQERERLRMTVRERSR